MGLIKIHTPLLCFVPCEKNTSQPHSFFQTFSSFGSEYVSCKKIYVSFLVFQKREDRPPFDLISNSPNVKRKNIELTKRIVQLHTSGKGNE